MRYQGNNYSTSPTHEPSSWGLSRPWMCFPSASRVSDIAAHPLPFPVSLQLSSPTPPSSSHWLLLPVHSMPALRAHRWTALHCFSRHCTVRWKTPYCLCLFIIYHLWEEYYKPIAVQYYIADCVSCVSRLILLDLWKNWTCEYTLGTEFVHMEETHCIMSFKSSRNCYTAAIFCVYKYHCLTCVCVLTPFSHVSLWPFGPYSPPGSAVHGLLQARILEWVAISSSRGSSPPRNGASVSYISCLGMWVLYR